MRSCPCRDGRRAVPAVPMGQLDPVDDEVFVAVPVDDEVADEPDEPLAAGVDVPLVAAPDPDDSPEAAVVDSPPAGDVADPEDRLSVL